MIGALSTISGTRLSSRFTRLGNSLSVGLETNGRGFMGFIVELPGAFVRGPVENEALSKVQREADSYLRWVGSQARPSLKTRVVQTHRCKLMVEDADSEILLDADRNYVSDQEFRGLVELVKYSGLAFTRLFDSAALKDWVDEARVRKTFYGQNKKTIREIVDHVKRTQFYYLSRTGVSFKENEAQPFMKVRGVCVDHLTSLYGENGNVKAYNVDNEDWTLKKILRRFVWHDRIHGKAIVRILEKEKAQDLIGSYDDPFGFQL